LADHPVTVVEAVEQPTAVVAAATTWSEYPQLWPDLLAEVWAAVRAVPGSAPGRNVMLYLDDLPNVEVGVEIGGSFAGRGAVVASALPAGRAATTVSRGAPSVEGLAAAHEDVIEWCGDNGYALTGVRWEIYDHWRDDQDPAAFTTEVYWLLR
jgi:effector-binding domain-containing protein